WSSAPRRRPGRDGQSHSMANRERAEDLATEATRRPVQDGSRMARSKNERVFTLATRAPVSPDLLTRSFDDAVGGAKPGLPRITLHGLRHAHATAMLAAGVPLKIVADRLGHASVRVTGDVYSHVVAGLDEQAAETDGRLLSAKAR